MYSKRADIAPNGDITLVDIDNEWILAHKPNTILLSADKSEIVGDGVDVATITLQLRTPPLVDGTYQNVIQSLEIDLLVDDTPVIVSLIDGVGELEVKSVEQGIFEIKCSYYGSNILQIEVV